MVIFGLSETVVSNTTLGHPFQVKLGMVDYGAHNLVISTVFGVYLPVTNESLTSDEGPPAHISGQELVVFTGRYNLV